MANCKPHLCGLCCTLFYIFLSNQMRQRDETKCIWKLLKRAFRCNWFHLSVSPGKLGWLATGANSKFAPVANHLLQHLADQQGKVNADKEKISSKIDNLDLIWCFVKISLNIDNPGLGDFAPSYRSQSLFSQWGELEVLFVFKFTENNFFMRSFSTFPQLIKSGLNLIWYAKNWSDLQKKNK